MPNKRYNKQIFKMADGGSISPKDIEKMTEKAKPAVEQAFSILKKFKEKKDKKKQIKGDSGKQKKKAPFDAKDKPKSIREKIAPKKKMDRLKELREELKQDGGPIGAMGQRAAPRKSQYRIYPHITRKEKPKYITKKEKPQYITKKSKFITKKKKPVQSESKYITRKEKPKSIKEKIAPKKKMDRLKELREELE